MITVKSTDGSISKHADAESWHVDDFGDLHVRGKDKVGNVATYARGLWSSVTNLPNAVETSNNYANISVEIDPKQIAEALIKYQRRDGRNGPGLA